MTTARGSPGSTTVSRRRRGGQGSRICAGTTCAGRAGHGSFNQAPTSSRSADGWGTSRSPSPNGPTLFCAPKICTRRHKNGHSLTGWTRPMQVKPLISKAEERRTPVGRPDFKSGEGRGQRPWWVRLPPLPPTRPGSPLILTAPPGASPSRAR